MDLNGSHADARRHTGDTGVALRDANKPDRGEWPRYAKNRDGVEYRSRPIAADDLERDRLFIEHLSPASRYSRMMGLMREPSAALLKRLVNVDYRREMALVAVVGEGEEE